MPLPRRPQGLPHLAASVLALASAAFAGDSARPGEKVTDFDFKKLLNGDGRTAFSEFLGQPVLLEWWGTR